MRTLQNSIWPDPPVRTIRFPALPRILSERRNAIGWTRSRLAKTAQVCYATVQALEDGERSDPRCFTITKLAKALDMPLLELLGLPPAETLQDGDID